MRSPPQQEKLSIFRGYNCPLAVIRPWNQSVRPCTPNFLVLSIQTTERYLGSRQNLKEAVNGRLGLDE